MRADGKGEEKQKRLPSSDIEVDTVTCEDEKGTAKGVNAECVVKGRRDDMLRVVVELLREQSG
jgi:hypothetical protein